MAHLRPRIAVALIQRFDSVANLKGHLQCLVVDDTPSFVKASAPTVDEPHAVLETVITRLMKMLTCRGVMIDDMGQTYLAEPDDDVEAVHTLGPPQAAAVTNGVACGLRTGQGTLTPGSARPRRASPCVPTSPTSACIPRCS